MTTSMIHFPSADGKDESIFGVVITITVAATSGIKVDVGEIFTGVAVAGDLRVGSVASNVAGLSCSGVAKVRQPPISQETTKIRRSEFHFISLPSTSKCLPNGSRYALHAATRQSAGYCVSTPMRAGGRDWAPSRRSPGTR